MIDTKLKITTDDLRKSEILDAVTKQIRRPNLDEATCSEWSGWDDSGIYHVPYVGRYARVWIDCETFTATRCELI
jgi:hypothetical protein